MKIDPDNPGRIRVTKNEHEFGNFSFECETFNPSPEDMPSDDARKFLVRPVEWIFTENDSNLQRLYSNANTSPYVKDAFHEYVIKNNTAAVNPEKFGSKVAAYHVLKIPAGSEAVINIEFLWILNALKIFLDLFLMKFFWIELMNMSNIMTQ